MHLCRLDINDQVLQTNQWLSQVISCNFHVRGRCRKEDKPDLQGDRRRTGPLRRCTVGFKAV